MLSAGWWKNIWLRFTTFNLVKISLSIHCKLQSPVQSRDIEIYYLLDAWLVSAATWIFYIYIKFLLLSTIRILWFPSQDRTTRQQQDDKLQVPVFTRRGKVAWICAELDSPEDLLFRNYVDLVTLLWPWTTSLPLTSCFLQCQSKIHS